MYCGELKYFSHEEKTSYPVHLMFQSLDYDDETLNDNLLNLYTWSPIKVGKETSNVTNLSSNISNERKRNYKKPGCNVHMYESFKKDILRGIGFVEKLSTKFKYEDNRFTNFSILSKSL